jgi:stage V sporulation protein B
MGDIMNKKTIVSSAIILTIAGVITRLMGFAYRIFMSNTIGAEGMGLYQLILPVYGLVWSISCSGTTTTISKLTAQEKAKGEYGNVKLILKQSLFISTTISVLLSFIVFYYAETIAVSFFGDARVILSLQILSLAFPFMAIGSCLRGYFFGIQNAVVPAVNQVLEQMVRMFVIYILAGLLIPLGIEFAVAAAVIGIVAEEFFSLIYIVFAYNKKKLKPNNKTVPTFSTKASLLLIASMSLPLTANRVTGSLLATYENILIPQRLQMYGLSSSEAMATFGQLMGMALPLIFFPSSFLISLSISLVPAISEASAVKDYKGINYTITKCMLFASVIGFGAASLFVTFPAQIGFVIYNQDIRQMLMLLGIVSPFLYMQIILSGILNGLGYQMFIFKNSIISSLINIGFVYFLMPVIGINAFIFGLFFSISIVCALEINKLRETVDLQFQFSNWFLKPLLCALCAGSLSKFFYTRVASLLFGPIVSLVISICLLGSLYMVFIVLTGCLSIHDIKDLVKNVKPTGRRKKYA